jgi:hypothetical protein
LYCNKDFAGVTKVRILREEEYPELLTVITQETENRNHTFPETENMGRTRNTRKRFTSRVS